MVRSDQKFPIRVAHSHLWVINHFDGMYECLLCGLGSKVYSISSNFQQAPYSFDTAVNAQDAPTVSLLRFRLPIRQSGVE